MLFLKCNRDHHTVALARAPHASLNHIAFEVPSVDDVRHGVEHLRTQGYETIWGPGRHAQGKNVFGYFVTPNGQVVEYTADVEQIDDEESPRGSGSRRTTRSTTTGPTSAHCGRPPRHARSCSALRSAIPTSSPEPLGQRRARRDTVERTARHQRMRCGRDDRVQVRSTVGTGRRKLQTPGADARGSRAERRPVGSTPTASEVTASSAESSSVRHPRPARRRSRPTRRADPLGRTRRCPAMRSSDVTIDVPDSDTDALVVRRSER